MAHDFQVVVDCASPHALAEWWAGTLGWTVEEQDEAFIRQMIADGYATLDDTTTHGGKLVWADASRMRRGLLRIVWQTGKHPTLADLS